MKHFILFLLFVCIGCSIEAQGRVDGFFSPKGELKVAIGGGVKVGEGFYAGKQEITLERNIINYSAFVAYSLFDNLEVSATAAYVSINDVKNLQDGSIYLKYLLADYKIKQGTLSLAMAAGISSNLANYETEGLNAIGQQAKKLDFRPLMHYSFRRNYFITSQFGYLINSNPTPNASNFVAKVGRAGKLTYIDIFYDYQKSDGGLNYRGDPVPSTFKELGVDYQKVGATIFFSILPYLGVYTTITQLVDGRNIDLGIEYNFGIVLKHQFQKTD